MKASSDVMERIGLLADRVDNFYHASLLKLPPRIHVEGLRAGLMEVRDELRYIFKEVTGDDPWSD